MINRTKVKYDHCRTGQPCTLRQFITEDRPMSMNSDPIAMDLEALPDEPAFDEELAGDDDPVENQRELSNSEYDALEEAVMQTVRGRTFLREHAQRNRAVASDLVLRAMDDCRDYFKRHELKQPSEILSAELQNMSDAISDTRRDIAAIKPKEGANNRIMAATADLDAIFTSTERATHDILAAAERIQDSCHALREKDADGGVCDAMEEDITNIFLACSFQDLTGQRTTKVVNALHYLEQRVGAMIQIWGSESLRNASLDEIGPGSDDHHAEADLLNGPQIEGHGVAQDDIDQMLRGDTDRANEGAQTNDEAVDGADPTEGIEFDGPKDLEIESLPEDRLMDDDVADPTEGVEFDAPAKAPSEDDGAVTADAADADQDQVDNSNPGGDMDNKSIDAMFDC